MREKDQSRCTSPATRLFRLRVPIATGEVTSKRCVVVLAVVHSHSRHTGVTEVGDSPQIEVASVQSDRWIFAIMEKYPTTNDTDFAVSSSSLIELNARNFDVCGVHE